MHVGVADTDIFIERVEQGERVFEVVVHTGRVVRRSSGRFGERMGFFLHGTALNRHECSSRISQATTELSRFYLFEQHAQIASKLALMPEIRAATPSYPDVRRWAGRGEALAPSGNPDAKSGERDRGRWHVSLQHVRQIAHE